MKETQIAIRIAKYFFAKTNRRATKATMSQSIGQSLSLLSAKFTEDEIIQGIDYCVENPGPKGFTSLGFLSYVLEDVLIKIKAKQKKQEHINTVINNTIEPYEQTKIKVKESKDRVPDGFDFNIMGE